MLLPEKKEMINLSLLTIRKSRFLYFVRINKKVREIFVISLQINNAGKQAKLLPIKTSLYIFKQKWVRLHAHCASQYLLYIICQIITHFMKNKDSINILFVIKLRRSLFVN